LSKNKPCVLIKKSVAYLTSRHNSVFLVIN